MKPKFLFVRIWQSPPIARSVAQMLTEAFPELEMEVIDLATIVKHRRMLMGLNLLSVIKDYGGDVLGKYKTLREAFWGTPYLFRRVKALMNELYANKVSDYKFSFQLQSLFDTSLAGIPNFVYTDHTLLENRRYPSFHPRKLYSDSWLKLEQTIYRNAARIFIRSANIQESLITDYDCPPSKTVCVYAGGNVPIMPSDDSLERYARKNILFVGVDWERKGGPALVEAFRQVLTVHPDAHLTIVGSTPSISLPNCHVVGYVPSNKLYSFYQEASLFCMPTRLEPFGAVFIEALGYRLPIVTSNVGATRDFVSHGENGYMLHPDDQQGLTQALLDLLGRPQRCQSFGAKGYALMQEKYTWPAVGAKIRQEVSKVVSIAT